MTKILYIEDTENNRILITRRLAQSDFTVITAETAEQGLAVARAEKPRLILMDMGLPGVDGWCATRLFKDDPVRLALDILVPIGARDRNRVNPQAPQMRARPRKTTASAMGDKRTGPNPPGLWPCPRGLRSSPQKNLVETM